MTSVSASMKGRIPDVFPVRMDWFCALLAEAEMMGGWRVLQEYENEAGRVAYLAKMTALKEQYAHLWEARIRGELEGKK